MRPPVLLPSFRLSSRAFTLVEILVVLGVIAVVLGTFVGVSRPGSSSLPLRGAQAEVAALLQQTRQTALLEGTEARLFVRADPSDRDRYLRFLGIVMDGDRERAGPQWVPATAGVTLPRGVYVIPPGAMGPGGADSVLQGPESLDSGVAEAFSWFVTFAPDGTVATAEGTPRLAVGLGRPDPRGNGVIFDEPERVRGVLVRRYGAVVLLDSRRAFPGAGGS